MAFTRQELREMRENSRIGAAKQRLKEEAALKKYMDNREEDIKKTMTVNERIQAIAEAKQRGLSNQEIAEELHIKYETVCTYVCKARKDGLLEYADKPAEQSGMIDAAELDEAAREALTEEIEAEIEQATAEQPAQEQTEQTEPAAQIDLYSYAIKLATTLREMLRESAYKVQFECSEGLYTLTVDGRDNESAQLTWGGTR